MTVTDRFARPTPEKTTIAAVIRLPNASIGLPLLHGRVRELNPEGFAYARNHSL
jgi:monomeric isocitrate dehydrogenase